MEMTLDPEGCPPTNRITKMGSTSCPSIRRSPKWTVRMAEWYHSNHFFYRLRGQDQQ
jgi:hypothetical protein